MSVHIRLMVAALLAGLSAAPLYAQQLPVLPPLEEEPLVQPPQVEAPPYPVEQLPPMQAEPIREAPRPAAVVPDTEPMFSGGGVAIQGGLGPSTQLLLSFNASSVLLGLGLGFGYNQAGVAPASSMDVASETISFQIALSVAIMAYNTKPLAFGPELDFESQLAPGSPFDISTLTPGFAMWYAPFPTTPLMIGTMLGLRIGFTGYGNPTISTDYPGVRLRWGF
jgi:hypothetical protein